MSDIEDKIIKGFYYFKNIIDEKTGADIYFFLNTQEWKGISASFNGRKIQQYGYEYNYSTRQDSDYKKIEDIPEILLHLQQIGIQKIKNELANPEEFNACTLNQCIVNKYESKQGISAHIDKETFGTAIVCFTLGSGTTVTFSNNCEKVEKYVEPNSLYIMTGRSRYSWKHEIIPRAADNGVKRETRISVTFRTVI